MKMAAGLGRPHNALYISLGLNVPMRRLSASGGGRVRAVWVRRVLIFVWSVAGLGVGVMTCLSVVAPFFKGHQIMAMEAVGWVLSKDARLRLIRVQLVVPGFTLKVSVRSLITV